MHARCMLNRYSLCALIALTTGGSYILYIIGQLCSRRGLNPSAARPTRRRSTRMGNALCFTHGGGSRHKGSARHTLADLTPSPGEAPL